MAIKRLSLNSDVDDPSTIICFTQDEWDNLPNYPQSPENGERWKTAIDNTPLLAEYLEEEIRYFVVRIRA